MRSLREGLHFMMCLEAFWLRDMGSFAGGSRWRESFGLLILLEARDVSLLNCMNLEAFRLIYLRQERLYRDGNLFEF